METKHLIQEIVIEYRPEDLDIWKRGHKEPWLNGMVPDEIWNQPEYSFGEYYTLHCFERACWKGFVFYALGEWEPDNRKYAEGRKVIESRLPFDRLFEFRKLRPPSIRSGEPDLFLFMENGPNLFLEVKKDHDPVSSAQLTCLDPGAGLSFKLRSESFTWLHMVTNITLNPTSWISNLIQAASFPIKSLKSKTPLAQIKLR
jgi:hypothetical protein